MTKTTRKPRSSNVEDLAAHRQLAGLQEFTIVTADGRISQTAKVVAQDKARAVTLAMARHREATQAPSSRAVLVRHVIGPQEAA